MAIATLNPATEEMVQAFDPLTDEAIAQKLDLAQRTFEQYRHSSFAQRAEWLQAAAKILEDEKKSLGKIMTLEMGKPIKASISEAEKCATVCRFYAEQGAVLLKDVEMPSDASHSFVRYQPLGVILAVMPWNFPFWQVFRFAAPALMAGNVGILKHASNVPQCALAIESILHRAGFPEGAFQSLLIGSDKVAQIIADDRVKAATLTGSEGAGASLASTAGKHLKKVVLELGGSDPFIVMESADLDTALATAVTARMLNNGQSCIAAKRFIVQESIADTFTKDLVAKFAALKVGDPMNPETQIGPLATATILKELNAQVQSCLQQGGKLLIGGAPLPNTKGNYYPPTILTDIPPTASTHQEEFFGPVALLYRVPDLDAAIKLANSTSFGLGSSAWTEVEAERDRLINEIEAGCVFINGMVKSDPRLPFGGVKRSGFGRELSAEGIREFVNIKTIWVK